MWGTTKAPAGLWVIRRLELKRRVELYVRTLLILDYAELGKATTGSWGEHADYALRMLVFHGVLDTYFSLTFSAFKPPLDPLLTLEYGCYFMEGLFDLVDDALRHRS